MFNEISNKAATFHFLITDTFIAGIQLKGSEVKAIRAARVNLSDAYCYFKKGELWLKNMHIGHYIPSNQFNHEEKAERKLLLTARELRKIEAKVKEKGFTIVPTRMFLSERGFLKLEIGLARGKTHGDKRQSIKAKEDKRMVEREIKQNQ